MSEVKTHNRDIALVDEHCRKLKLGTKKEQYLAQAEILKCFDSYLEKYTNLFHGSAADIRNYDTRCFLAMFLTGRPKNNQTFTYQKQYIAHVLKNYSREDIKADLTVLFLNVLAKYRIVEGVNALNPLTKVFRWRMKDWFNRKARDIFGKVVYFADISHDLTESELEPSCEFEEPDGFEIDIDWISNPSEDIYSGIYITLSPYERYLIYMVYKEGKPLADIAAALDRDKDTIKKHLRDALKHLRECALISEFTIEAREEDG